MLKKFSLLFGFSFLMIIAFPQNKNFIKRGNEFTFFDKSKEVKVEFCTPSMFRVRATWNKKYEPDEPWMVVKYDWPVVNISSSEHEDFFLLESSQLKIKVFKSSLKIDVLTKDDKILSAESEIKNGGISKNDDTVSCTKNLNADEHFFGFGERMDFLDQRNKKLKLNVGRGNELPYIVGAYNILEANYCPVPFFMSTKGYGIFFHTAYPTQWDMGAEIHNQYSFRADGGELDYYFIYGPAFPLILNQYTSVTGKEPLMSLFAYGLHLGTYAGGTWNYEQLTSDKYVIELAKKLRALGIPVDILWLDSTWRIFGEVGGKGATSFEWKETFNNPKGMFDSLYKMNFKMVGLHLRPRFDNGKVLKLLDTAQKLGYTFPEGKYAGEFVNFFDSSSVNWWWNHGVMKVAAQGARFLKTDEGSAFGSLANESDKIGPQGKDISKLHNLFPIAYAKAPYEKFQQLNNMRGLNQTREGYAGIQRYPYIFAGDWPSEWQYFAPVIKAGLNIGLSGVGNWAHCMGGFEHVADPELYIRWVQFGMFSPVAMVFGMDHPGYKEPWNYGTDALRNFEKYDSLRYRLLPYIYSNAFAMYKTGLPLMKALVLDNQEDENVYDISDQYMFGNNLMVCPVTVKGAQTRTIYLPKGDWFNYWTGKKYSGKQYVHVVTPLDTIPIFAKAGAIIPMQPAMKYVGEKPVDVITLEIFPNEKSSFDLYEDDNKSLDYKNEDYAISKINVSFSDGLINININKPSGKYIPTKHNYLLKVHLNNQPLYVKENNIKSSDWNYDHDKNILMVKTSSYNNKDIRIEILTVK